MEPKLETCRLDVRYYIHNIILIILRAESAGAVEYTNCISDKQMSNVEFHN